jgi:hypothetical protein
MIAVYVRRRDLEIEGWMGWRESFGLAIEINRERETAIII